MIKIEKVDRRGNGCNACDFMHNHTYQISLIPNPNQSICIGMCSKCLKELEDKISKIRKVK